MTPNLHRQLEHIYAASFKDYMKNGPDDICDYCWNQLHHLDEEDEGYCCCPLPKELEAMGFASHDLWMQCKTLPDDEYIGLLNEFANRYVSAYTVVHTGDKGSQMVSFELKPMVATVGAPRGGALTRVLWTVLETLLPERIREATLGDLEEIFGTIRIQKGDTAARIWLITQCLHSLQDALLSLCVSVATIYLLNHCKTAFQHIIEWLCGNGK